MVQGATERAVRRRLPHVWGEDADKWDPERFSRLDAEKQVKVGVYANLYVAQARSYEVTVLTPTLKHRMSFCEYIQSSASFSGSNFASSCRTARVHRVSLSSRLPMLTHRLIFRAFQVAIRVSAPVYTSCGCVLI